MKTEQIDGSVITELYTDEAGRTWYICRREGGSMSLYCSRSGHSVVYVIYDTLDGKPPNARAREIISRIGRVADEVNMLRDLAIDAACHALDTTTPEETRR
jgi:phytoene/squalene synthetase